MLSLYIDLSKRKVAEFEDEKVKLMDDFINLNKSNFKDNDLVITGKLKKCWKLNYYQEHWVLK